MRYDDSLDIAMLIPVLPVVFSMITGELPLQDQQRRQWRWKRCQGRYVRCSDDKIDNAARSILRLVCKEWRMVLCDTIRYLSIPLDYSKYDQRVCITE